MFRVTEGTGEVALPFVFVGRLPRSCSRGAHRLPSTLGSSGLRLGAAKQVFVGRRKEGGREEAV